VLTSITIFEMLGGYRP